MTIARQALLALFIVLVGAGGTAAQQEDKWDNKWDLNRLVPPTMPLLPRSQLDPGTLGNTPPPYTTAPLQAPNSAAPTAPGLKLTIPSR
jgi:hypothetical protein